MTSYLTQFLSGYKKTFKDKSNKERLVSILKEQDFGPKENINIYNETRKETPMAIQLRRTTFTCVMRGIATNVKVEELKKHSNKEERIQIKNARRINNTNRPLPLVRLFTKYGQPLNCKWHYN